MVLEPNLLPQFVDVVIGEYLYELQFRVEDFLNSEELVPLDMDDTSGEGKEDQKKQEHNGKNRQFKQQPSAPENNASGSKHGGSGAQNIGRKMVDLDGPLLSTKLVDRTTKALEQTGDFAADGSQEDSLDSVDFEAVLRTPDTSSLAAIPEVGNGSSGMYRSKRRAENMDEDVLARASRIKASCNLDKAFSGGTVDAAY
jgi:hypothetical protein